MTLLNGKVAIVTGAGRGLGRAHALALGDAGARVVVNDLGASLAGEGADTSPADEVVAEIEARGGEAVANGEDVAHFAGAERLIAHAVDAFGQLDVLVNNAGILRDRMLVNSRVVLSRSTPSSTVKAEPGRQAEAHFHAPHMACQRDRTSWPTEPSMT